MQVFQRVGQAMYDQQQSAQSAPSEGAGSSAGDGTETEAEDDVVEGEIVDEGGAS